METERTLHDCCDCEGCIYEDECATEDEERHSGLLTEDEE